MPINIVAASADTQRVAVKDIALSLRGGASLTEGMPLEREEGWA